MPLYVLRTTVHFTYHCIFYAPLCILLATVCSTHHCTLCIPLYILCTTVHFAYHCICAVYSGVMPLGAVVVADHVQKQFEHAPFPHGSTNNSHLLSVAVAHATLDYMVNHDVLGNVGAREAQLRSWLEQMKVERKIKGYRLRGLMGCIVCNPPQNEFTEASENACYSSNHADMLESLYQKGVYTLMREDLLFLGPPLTITENELKQALDIIENSVVESQHGVHKA